MTQENALPQDDGIVVSTVEQASPPEISQEPESKAPVEGEALATSTDVEPAKPQEPELTEAARKAINKKHWQAKEAERRAEALQAELDSIKAQSESAVVPDIPPLPDPFELSDEEYQQRMAERDKAMAARLEHDANIRAVELQQQAQQDEVLRQQQAESDRIRSEYAKKATGLGLNADDVMQHTVDVINYGVSDAVAEMFITEADGPLMASYLRNNPHELDSLRSMSIAQQVQHMYSSVRQGAESLKPRTSSAPPPPTEVAGGGQLNKPDPLLEGVTIITS